MSKIVRTPMKALGGVTPEELERMREHSELWIKRAFRTDPIVPEKIIPAIEGLYEAAGLKKPRVVIAPSPLVMAFAYGAAAAIWYARGQRDATYSATYIATDNATNNATDSATRNATVNAAHNAALSATIDATDSATRIATVNATDNATGSATRDATYSATYSATVNATDSATINATHNATRSATINATINATHNATHNATDIATYSATDSATGSPERGAARACYALAGELGLACAKRWNSVVQTGNMGAAWASYLTAFRDILGLDLPEHKAFASWEAAAIEGGFRVMHPEFCIVSDFPEFIRIDDQNRPHCETGPSHRWRDGWSLYHWHGTRIPAEWIEQPGSLTAKAALSEPNLELRRAAIEILGWSKILRELDAKVIDADGDPLIGTLLEVRLPDLDRPARFCRVQCGTGREFAIGVPPDINTALEAQAWMVGTPANEFTRPEVRT